MLHFCQQLKPWMQNKPIAASPARRFLYLRLSEDHFVKCNHAADGAKAYRMLLSLAAKAEASERMGTLQMMPSAQLTEAEQRQEPLG